MTYNVTRRRREIDIRMALGSVQLVKSLLFGITPRDPLTFVTALSSLIVITILASLLRAARGARVDPMLALRAE